MADVHSRTVPKGPTRRMPRAKEAQQPRPAGQKGVSRSKGSPVRADPGQARTAKVVILSGGAGLVVILLLAFTLYAVQVSSEAMLRDLLDFTKFLAAVVLLWALGPKLGRVLVGSGKGRDKDGR